MDSKKLSEYRKKYAISKHHAWAGSVLLAILLAIRIFIQSSKIKFDDRIILLIALSLVFYMLFALIFTFRYRAGLFINEKSFNLNIYETTDEKKKIRFKIEKKKAKSELKKSKKSNK